MDDFGKDLAGVEALMRKQGEVERDLSALQNQLEVNMWNLIDFARNYTLKNNFQLCGLKDIILISESHSENQILYLTVLPLLTKDDDYYY